MCDEARFGDVDRSLPEPPTVPMVGASWVCVSSTLAGSSSPRPSLSRGPQMVFGLWKDIRLETDLRKLWAEGKSASAIAAILCEKYGVRVTRNAVIGKIHRLDIARPKNFQHNPRRRKNTDVAERNRRIVSMLRREAAISAARINPAPEDKAHKSLLELEPDDCRFVVGEPTGICFCAAPRLIGSPYCSNHHVRAYVAPKIETSAILARNPQSVEA